MTNGLINGERAGVSLLQKKGHILFWVVKRWAYMGMEKNGEHRSWKNSDGLKFSYGELVT